MLTKRYFDLISHVQDALLSISLALLVALPITLAYFSDSLSDNFYTFLFELSLFAVFLVMIVRPLADLFPKAEWLRPLVILRKGFGVFSAAIIVSFMLSKVMTDGSAYFAGFFDAARWSVADGSVLSPVGDVSALILLVTSNKYSKRVLGSAWKRIQKLSYVYFYAGALYEFLLLGNTVALVYMLIVSVLLFAAYAANKKRVSLASV
jgi:DMSO/TMAO reductase YedYZ heme-binding membrane subunit